MHLAQRQVGGALAQLVLVGAVAALFVGFGQPGVDEGAQFAGVTLARSVLRCEPFLHHLGPAQPAQRAVEAVQLKATHLAALGAGVDGSPLACSQHAGFVVFADLASAMPADVVGGLWHGFAVGVFLPLDAVAGGRAPLQRLKLLAMWARHPILAAVAGQVFGLDPAKVFGGGCAGFQALAPGKG